MNDEGVSRSRGVQSVEVSVGLLTALAANGGPMALSELAAAVDMAPAKVHRYLASFVESGMVDHRHSGTYDLGPRAAEIGVAAIARIDPVNRAADALADLVEETNLTALLSVWGNAGPTVVRWERATTPLVTTLGLGSVLPATSSATGHAFISYLADRLVAPVIAREAPDKTLADFASLRARVRAEGVATADQDFIPGLFALAAPVLSLDAQPVAVVTLIATERQIISPGHRAREHLIAFTRSKRSK